MIILGLDTCLAACSAALVGDGEILASVSEPMARGHQERLAPLVEALMAEAGLTFTQLDRVSVTVGPGSFTGLRVGLAFAKGISEALERPLVGVSTLEALAFGLDQGLCLCAIDANRGQVYFQAWLDGTALGAPQVLSVADAVAATATLRPDAPCVITGPGAHLIHAARPTARHVVREICDPVAIAGLGAASLTPARPLYLRAPDAKPAQAS